MVDVLDKVSIVIPVHNIIQRGYKRVRHSVLSLRCQIDYIDEIIIVDSSDKVQYDMLHELIKGFVVNHIHIPLYCFNKPKLLNTGIRAAKSKYIMCTDSDYIFGKDFLYYCSEYRNKKTILHKQVKMLPSMKINDSNVLEWHFPKSQINKWGKLANGACQYATRDFFIANPYPEEMDGFSAMDNMMTYIAYNNGLTPHWIVESEILHQHHNIVNKMGGSNREKFDRNQAMLQAYINDNNLPCLLTK